MHDDLKDTKEKLSFHFNNSIKVFMSLYKFQKELLNNKVTSKEVILINKNRFSVYKKFYLCDKVFELIKTNNLSEFDSTEQKIIFNNLFNDFYNQNSAKPSLLFHDEEFPNIILSKDDITIKFIDEFEIIDEETYQNLMNCMGIFSSFGKNAEKF